MRGIRVLSMFVLLVALPSAARAVTTEQVVALKKAGVSDAVILALIERDHTLFSIQPEQIIALQHEGLSEAIIVAMLKSGQAGDEAARAEAAYQSALVAAAVAPGPEVLIVGHGPERPNTYHYDGFFTNANNPYLFPLYGGSYFPPYGSPYEGSIPGAVPVVAPRLGPRLNRQARPRALCYAQMSTSASRGNSLGYVTACPPVLQPSRTFTR
jgi:hypothetical protein